MENYVGLKMVDGGLGTSSFMSVPVHESICLAAQLILPIMFWFACLTESIEENLLQPACQILSG